VWGPYSHFLAEVDYAQLTTDAGCVARILEQDSEAVLAECEYLHSEFLVAGAYEHSQLSETVFGGVSRALLR
jgi:hypothetical protein